MPPQQVSHQINQLKLLPMLLGVNPEDSAGWATDMHCYEKEKRTKKPFGKQFKPVSNIVTSGMVKQRQAQFNPVLQTYRSEQKQQHARAQQVREKNLAAGKHYVHVGKHTTRDFDIINLHGSNSEDQSRSPVSIAPVRNIYNPISNQPLSDYYYRNRQVRLPHQHRFKSLRPSPSEFDIITNEYHRDNEVRQTKQTEQNNAQVQEKYRKTHEYNSIFGRYYDPEKERQYEKQLQQSQLAQSSGEMYNRRFPPVYHKREPLVLDSTKPLSQSLIEVDRRRQNAKQRYKLKYILQKQYQKRNLEDDLKKQAMLRNRVHNSQSLQHKAKQFANLELPLLQNVQTGGSLRQAYPEFQRQLQNLQAYSQKLSHREPSSRGNIYSRGSSIKSGGFD